MQRMKSQKFKGKFSLLVQKDKLYDEYFIVKNNKEIKNEEDEKNNDEISENENDEDELEQWQGIVKELKNDIRQNFSIAKKEIMMGEKKGKSEILMKIQENQNKIQPLEKNLEDFKAEMLSKLQDNSKKVKHLHEDIDEIKAGMNGIIKMLKL